MWFRGLLSQKESHKYLEDKEEGQSLTGAERVFRSMPGRKVELLAGGKAEEGDQPCLAWAGRRCVPTCPRASSPGLCASMTPASLKLHSQLAAPVCAQTFPSCLSGMVTARLAVGWGPAAVVPGPVLRGLGHPRLSAHQHTWAAPLGSVSLRSLRLDTLSGC